MAAAGVVATGIALSACGGGGGGDTAASSGNPPAQSNGRTITEQSAPTYAASAYSGAQLLLGSGTGSAIGMKDTSGPATPVRQPLAIFALGTLQALQAPATGGAGIETKVVRTGSALCAGGGGSTVTVDDANNNQLFDTGDSATVVFDRCGESGFVYTGRMTIGQLLITGSAGSPSRSAGATFGFQALNVTSPGEPAATIDGAFAIQASYSTQPAPTIDATLAGTSLKITSGARIATLTNFASTASLNENTGAYRYSIGGTLSGTGLSGAVTIATPTPLTGTLGTFASAGTMRVQAADGSAVRLTAQSNTSVVLDLDSNGDGVYESTRTMTWSQLVAAY